MKPRVCRLVGRACELSLVGARTGGLGGFDLTAAVQVHAPAALAAPTSQLRRVCERAPQVALTAVTSTLALTAQILDDQALLDTHDAVSAGHA